MLKDVPTLEIILAPAEVRSGCNVGKNKQENFLDPLSSMKPEMQVPKNQLLDIKVPTALHPVPGKMQ